MKAFLTRLYDDGRQTLGILQVFGGIVKQFECKTLELAWKNNQRQISCIPVGTYAVKKHNSPSKGLCFQVQNVPDRSHILLHSGSFYIDTLGCILLGKDFIDLNNDGLTDITHSKLTIQKLLSIMPDEFELTITE